MTPFLNYIKDILSPLFPILNISFNFNPWVKILYYYCNKMENSIVRVALKSQVIFEILGFLDPKKLLEM